MSFKDTLEEKREDLRKSNRENLAHAYLRVEERIAELKEKIKKQEALLQEIESAGDESKLIDQNSAVLVKKLYDSAFKEWYD